MEVENIRNGNGPRAIEDTYQKLSQLEHILLRPDTYIGSAERTSMPLWLWNDENEQMESREVSFVPGLYKIFDEILVNAADHKQRDASMDTIEVFIDEENNRISVKNNGSGIPVEIHKKEGVYVPELIFGHLLTSSNYNDNEKKVVGGRNGYGAKLANIFSTEFVIETADQGSNKRYHQVFKNNMTKKMKPSIKEGLKKNEQWTRISFQPDLERFGLTHLEADVVGLMKKRVYDIAGCSPGVKVYLNGKKLPIKSFKDYVGLYFEDKSDVRFIHERCSPRWEVVVAPSDGQFQNISFVNSIWTMKGGTHVNHVSEQVAAHVIEHLTKKNKGLKLKPFQVKNQMTIFINCLIENPSFDSQTKENMTSRPSSFGSKCELSPDFYKKILKNPLIENILSFARFKQSNELKKTDGGKQRKLVGIPKLDDANFAGTKDSARCTLILTEGDSAKSLAVSGFSVVGRDYFGVFPLRGKLLNVRDANHKQIMDNAEINNLKKILGLQHNKVYDRDSIKTLRYGRVMIMTDQDHDGSHIKGLLINFFQHFWPSLIKLPHFMAEFVTPIVKCTKGKNEKVFFTLPEYDQWQESLGNNTNGWKIKYYKGLGTSTSAEAREYFSHLDRHVIEFKFGGDGDFAAIDMAFSKQSVQQRKDWLADFEEGTYFDHERDVLSYSNFINKELILFSIADNERSIPGLMDGLKPSQRKVVFSCFKRKLKNELKVAQLAGYVSEHSAYHHGEASLMATIIGLAQNFIGSNNLNLLHPAGQFGTRLQGGKDAASPRYIFTRLTDIARLLFPSEDDPILEYLEDDGLSIEPKYFAPTIPTVLVNGTEGIGTGWSSSVPSYNPKTLIEMVRMLLHDASPDELPEPEPWYRRHKGLVRRTGPKNYEIYGEVRRLEDNKFLITELPAKSWTTPYKEWLESVTIGSNSDSKEKPFLTDVRDNSTENDIKFTIEISPDEMAKVEEVGIYKKLRLVSSVATSNMVLFDVDRKLQKYEDVRQILLDFFTVRLELYEKRRIYLLACLKDEVDVLENKVRFIQMVISGKLKVAKRKKEDLISELTRLKFKPIPPKKKKEAAGDAVEQDKGDEEDVTVTPSQRAYDYLLSMPLWSLTLERVESLVEDRDQKVDEMRRMENSTAKDLYSDDLEKLEEGLEVLEKATKVETAELAKAAKQASAKAKGTGRKKAVQVYDMEDEDVGEVVPLPALKFKAPKRVAKAVSAKNLVSDDLLSSLSISDKKSAQSGTTAKSKSSAANKIISLKPRGKKAMVLDDDSAEESSDDSMDFQSSGSERIEIEEVKPKAARKKTAPVSGANGNGVSKPKLPSFFKQAPVYTDNVPDDAGSDDDLELTLTERLARKMVIGQRTKVAKATAGADDDEPHRQTGAPAKRGRKPKAAAPPVSPFGSTPDPKKSRLTKGMKGKRIVAEDSFSESESENDADFANFVAPERSEPAKKVKESKKPLKPSVPKKKIVANESDEESDFETPVEVTSKATKPAKSRKAQKIVASESEDESDFESPMKVTSKPTMPAKSRKAPKDDEKVKDPTLRKPSGRARKPIVYEDVIDLESEDDEEDSEAFLDDSGDSDFIDDDE